MYTMLAERRWIPDTLIRVAMRSRIHARSLSLSQGANHEFDSIDEAKSAEESNRQHYELPPAFFESFLGPRLKYSCCLYEPGVDNLPAAEIQMLERTVQRADILDGMEILDLGCGWGSLSLFLAERFPRSRITALSNSRTQKEFIDQKATQLQLSNLQVITANALLIPSFGTFDRIVSIEMLEHIRDHSAMLSKIAAALKPQGKLFTHVFCHRTCSYPFDARSGDDWLAKHFFAGGMMPSFHRLPSSSHELTEVQSWKVDGSHYARTCQAWLRNLDQQRTRALEILRPHYGARESNRQLQRWRMFLMACAELFAYNNGSEWFVAHHLFTRNTKDC